MPQAPLNQFRALSADTPSPLQLTLGEVLELQLARAAPAAVRKRLQAAERARLATSGEPTRPAPCPPPGNAQRQHAHGCQQANAGTSLSPRSSQPPTGSACTCRPPVVAEESKLRLRSGHDSQTRTFDHILPRRATWLRRRKTT